MPLTRLLLRPALVLTVLCALLIPAMLRVGESSRNEMVAFRALEYATQASYLTLADVSRGLWQRITPYAYGPEWSPDGEVLLYLTCVESSLCDLIAWDVGENPPRRLDYGMPFYYTSTLHWSPDGDVILQHSPDQPPRLRALSYPQEQMQPLMALDNNLRHGAPFWSPDGERVAFITAPESLASREVQLLDWGGSLDDMPLTRMNRSVPLLSGNITWSPDGSRMAYSAEGDGVGGRSMEIFITSPDGDSTPQNMTDFVTEDTNPAWSPQGRYIAFLSARNSTRMVDLYTMDLENPGGVLSQRLTDTTGTIWEYAWSPDGEHIAFISDRDGQREVYMIDRDGNNQRRITIMPGFDAYELVWRP